MIYAVKAVAILILSVWSMMAMAQDGSDADAASQVQAVQEVVSQSVVNAESQPVAAEPKVEQSSTAQVEKPKDVLAKQESVAEPKAETKGAPTWQLNALTAAILLIGVLKLVDNAKRKRELFKDGVEVLYTKSGMVWFGILSALAIASMVAYSEGEIWYLGAFLLIAVDVATTPLREICYDEKKNIYLISCRADKVDASSTDDYPGLAIIVLKMLVKIPVNLADRKVYIEVPVDSITGAASWMQRKLVEDSNGGVKAKHKHWVNIHSRFGSWRFTSSKEGKVEALRYRVMQLSNLSE